MQNGDEMAPKKDLSNPYVTLAAKRGSPNVVDEIDKALEEMRHEYLDLMDLRKSAVRRHGERGPAPAIPDYIIQDGSGVRPVEPSPQSITLKNLSERYKSDPASPYHNVGFKSKVHYDALIQGVVKDHADCVLSEIKARELVAWHAAWKEGGKIAVAHSKVQMLRQLFTFGATILDDLECVRLSGLLHTLRFELPKRRTERLTSEQVIAIRAKAHERNRPSIALAQALQFELGLTQRAVIGEWVPNQEPGESDITSDDGFKWMRGIRWSDIDDNMELSVAPLGQDVAIPMNLRQAPMVMEELKLIYGFDGDRSVLERAGAVVISEHSKLPWEAVEFRRWWRILANACGISKKVRNMDSRPKIGRRSPQDEPDVEEDDADEEFSEEAASSLH